MKIRQWMTMAGLVAVLGLTSACTIEISRNDDGSLSVESVMTEVSLQSEMEAALEDGQVEDVSVDLSTGHIYVTAERHRAQGGGFDELSFRVELGVSGGQLTATIYDAKLNGVPFNDSRLATWNGRIADRLTRAAQRHPNSALEAVSVTDDGLKMRWHVETHRSLGD